jgi:2-hydroxychromene-2-carboxylate isomerase
MTTTARFWFDPTCPFTWATSRWLHETAPAQGAQVEWRLMSLAVLNHGTEAVGALFAAIGTRIHEQRRTVDDALLTESLQEAGLPADLLAAADDTSYDDAVRSSHAEAQERVGTESGSPVLAIGDGPAWFGPVVSPVPTGQAATDLWQGLVALSKVEQFSELKRSRLPLHG